MTSPSNESLPTKATPIEVTMLDVLTEKWKLEAEVGALRMDLKAAHEMIGFLRSCVLSGETLGPKDEAWIARVLKGESP